VAAHVAHPSDAVCNKNLAGAGHGTQPWTPAPRRCAGRKKTYRAAIHRGRINQPEGTMRHRWSTVLAVTTLATAAGMAVPAAALAASCTYPLTILPMPPNSYNGRVIASGADNLFAGTTQSTTIGFQAVRWRGSTVTSLGHLPEAYDNTVVDDINASGTVVGAGYLITDPTEEWQQGEWHPFRSVGDHLEELPRPAGVTGLQSLRILDNGDIYGGDGLKLFRWPAAGPGTVEQLPGIPAGRYAALAGVDEDGTVALTLPDTETTYKSFAYRWKNGVLTRLPLPSGAAYSEARETRNGRIVGTITTPDFQTKAVLWDNDGTAKYLDRNGYLPFAINATGLIDAIDQQSTEYIWDKTTRRTAVPSTAWHIFTITDGGTLGGFGGPNSDKPIIMRCN
jgi:hypothetical protein